jgi:hypothetical protein
LSFSIKKLQKSKKLRIQKDLFTKKQAENNFQPFKTIQKLLLEESLSNSRESETKYLIETIDIPKAREKAKVSPI